MSQGAFVTLVGFVAQDPSIKPTKNGKLVTDVRVGTTPRYRDTASGEWRDGQTSYFTVSCWQRLADHARASLRKGDPVLVKGRFRAHSYEDRNGQIRTEIRITADTLGHDLTRGNANYMRPRPQQTGTQEDPDLDQAQGGPDVDEESGEMLDEEAIERFGRELDDADRAAQALAGSGDDGDGDGDEPAEPGEPAASPVVAPF
jgi:single-strand DNA-binding protein